MKTEEQGSILLSIKAVINVVFVFLVLIQSFYPSTVNIFVDRNQYCLDIHNLTRNGDNVDTLPKGVWF